MSDSCVGILLGRQRQSVLSTREGEKQVTRTEVRRALTVTMVEMAA